MTWTMAWDKNTIKQLRLRMGWSQCDLARRLNVEAEIIMKLEEGEMIPQPHHESYFSLLQQHAESASEEVAMAPLAETVLDDQHLNQIDRTSLLDKLKP